MNLWLRRIAFIVGVAALATLAPTSPGRDHRPVSQAHASTKLSGSTTTLRTSGCWNPRTNELGFAKKINDARRVAGRGSLRLDPELSRVARYHTWQMANDQNLYHTPSDRLRRRVTNWVVLGENVGVGGTVSSLHTAFMNSPAHKDNIMLPAFTHMGIATLQRGDRLWVTVLFESVTNPGTTLRMPSC